MSFKVTWKMHLICIAMAYMIMLLLDNSINSIIMNFALSGFLLYPTENVVYNFYIYAVIMLILISLVHELIHGVTFALFGGKVKYGFKIIYAYTREVSELPVPRTKFLVALLMPVVMISLASAIIGGWFGGMIYLLNLLGSTGDILMAFVLCRYDSECCIIDRVYGFDAV